MTEQHNTQVLVIGAGPAGYAAAFRAADLGLQTTLVERYPTLGGVCLNVGCIPSKALLHMAKVVEDAKTIGAAGVDLGPPQIDLEALRQWKEKVIGQLTTGLKGMAKQRKVTAITGTGKFTGPHTLIAEGPSGKTEVNFEHAVIAAGSKPVQLPFVPHDDQRVWDSTAALALPFIPRRLLVVGGGAIGLEMATVYKALGSEIHVVEFLDQLIPAADKDVVRLYTRQAKKAFKLMLSTKVIAVEAQEDGLHVRFEGKQAPAGTLIFDAVLVAVGRKPSGHLLDADKAGIRVTEAGFIETDAQMRTNVAHIYAVGDITGQPMLAHKGAHEGHVAAEAIAQHKHFFTPKVIPSIAYTQPEVGWVGLTEKEAGEQGITYETALFPWSALGRAIASQCANGMTKLIYEKETQKIIGGAVVGENGGEILGEIGLAIEMGADVEDLALTIHAHPTLYESIGLAAEIAEGTITDLPNKKAQKR